MIRFASARALFPVALGLAFSTLTLGCSSEQGAVEADASDESDEMSDEMTEDAADGSSPKDVSEQMEQDGLGGSTAATDEDPEEPVIPTVVTYYPEDQSAGFLHTRSPAIRFSVPMDPASFEAAYSSEDPLLAEPTFYWSPDNSYVNIEPSEELKFGSGTDPDLVETYEYNFVVADTATSAEGVPIAEPISITFTTARAIAGTLEPTASLTGSVNSKLGSFSTIWAGDSTYELDDGTDIHYLGVVHFDLAPLGEIVGVDAAAFKAEQNHDNPDPYEVLGGELQMFEVQYELRSWAEVQDGWSSKVEDVATDADSDLFVDVTREVSGSVRNGNPVQFGFSFPYDSNEDEDANNISLVAPQLLIQYYIP